jgi:hypothetical protein
MDLQSSRMTTVRRVTSLNAAAQTGGGATREVQPDDGFAARRK